MFIIVEYSAICKVIENPIIKYRTRMKEVIHLFTYAPLWQTLKDKGISQYELIKTYHISTGRYSADEQSSFFFFVAVSTAQSKSALEMKSGKRITEIQLKADLFV